MKKRSLRTLGVGFLLSAILTGAFAIFGQGQVPIAGISVNSLFNQNQTDNDQVLSQFRDQVSQLEQENAALSSENQSLLAAQSTNESVTTTSADTGSGDSIAPTAETTTQAVATEPAQEGVFTIQEGQVTSEIVQNLVDAGYVQNGQELEDLITQWGLDNLIQVGDYDLNSDMSVHQIAEIITNGQYYYIP
ncbi:TPA: hypothetical protein ACGO1T_000666 [Streptococcus suis]